MSALAQYARLRSALAEAVEVQEVLSIRDELEHVKLYAKQIQDRALLTEATVFQIDTESKLGKILAAAKDAGEIREGRPKKNGTPDKPFPSVTLADLGVGKNLSARAQRFAGMSNDELEAVKKATQERIASGRAKIIEDESDARSAESRRNLAQTLSDATALQPTGRKFPVIYADPAWRRKAGIGNRAYENHYTTETWDEILAMPVANRTLPDAWLFLWIPRAHLLALHPTIVQTELGLCKIKLPLAYAVAQAWGFDAYSTCFVWTKTDEECPEDHGLGLIVWDQDEILCLFKRGRGLPKPDTDVKVGSNHRERAGKHSAKPAYYRDMINAMTGNLPVLELFAREDENNWLPPNYYTWGNQSLNTAERIADDSGTNQNSETGTNHQPNGTDGRQATTSVSEPASAQPSAPMPVVDAGSPSFSESDLPEIILPGKWATFEHVAGFVDLTSEVAGRAS